MTLSHPAAAPVRPHDDTYLSDSPEECIATGDHLSDCDEDGYCNLCGHQDQGDPDPDPSQPQPSLHQRRTALFRRAKVLQDNGDIEGFTRTAASPRSHRPAGYAVKDQGTWTYYPGLAKVEAHLADRWNGRA